MQKIILAAATTAALAVPALAPAIASADVPRCQDTVTTPTTVVKTTTGATFTITQPDGAPDDWSNVWTYQFNVNINPADGSFTGTDTVTPSAAGVSWGERSFTENVTGSFSDINAVNPTITFTATRDFNTVGSWSETNAVMDGSISHASSVPDVGYPILQKISAPSYVVTTTTTGGDTTQTSYQNHGSYVSISGGGKTAAQSCIGMPIASKQGSK